jgi:hypothetical protein
MSEAQKETSPPVTKEIVLKIDNVRVRTKGGK